MRDPEKADVMLVNTCGFIEDAKRESIDEVLRLGALRAGGKRRLVVLGCLAERHGAELREALPEIDALFGVGADEAVAGHLAALPGGRAHEPAPERSWLFREGGHPGVAPLKVAEGCNRGCSFCAIPAIRGRFRSRPPAEVLADARAYVAAGARELLLVAQDLTRYRWEGGYGLPQLLRDLDALPGEFRIRPLYLYPGAIGGPLLDAIAGLDKVCAYVDMPVQHASRAVLRRMGRAGSASSYLALVRRIRRRIPDVALRTTVIVGFPGETEREFGELLDFVEQAEFDRLGAFQYSREEGTRAAALKPRVPERTKRERYDRLMRVQADISRVRNELWVGRTARVLIDEVHRGYVLGRTEGQAPEIDGHTVVRRVPRRTRPGDFLMVRIEGADEYDLEGEAVRVKKA